MSQEFKNFVYNPTVSGFDTDIWDALTGTPTESAGVLTFNAAEAITIANFNKGEFTFMASVPTVPTAADERAFGLYNVSLDAGAYFAVEDDVFMAVVKKGDIEIEEELYFDPAWASAEQKFAIRWESGLVRFFINETCVSTISTVHFDETELLTVDISGEMLGVYVRNENSDDLSFTFFGGKGIQSIASPGQLL